MAVANQDVEAALRLRLEADGYVLSDLRRHGETGVDILASKADESLHIEVIGFKDSPPARSKDFFEVFFRAISRLNQGATRIVIALPDGFSRGLRQRAAVYGPAWLRLGVAFPELEVWLVDNVKQTYRRTNWSDWFAPSPAPLPVEPFVERDLGRVAT